MPKTKKNIYMIRHKKYANFEKAAAEAIGQSLDTGEDITITEYGQTGTYNITVTAQAEKI